MSPRPCSHSLTLRSNGVTRMPISRTTLARPPGGNFLLRAIGIAGAVGLAIGLYLGIAHLL